MGMFDFLKRQKKRDEKSDLIYKAIHVLENYSDSDNDEDLIKRIETYTNDPILAWEIYCFIPIVYGRILFHDVKFSNQAMIMKSKGLWKTVILTKIDTYQQIEQVVIKKLKSNASKECIEKVLVLGSEIKAINDALNHGSKLSDLVTGPLLLIAPEDYVPKINNI